MSKLSTETMRGKLWRAAMTARARQKRGWSEPAGMILVLGAIVLMLMVGAVLRWQPQVFAGLQTVNLLRTVAQPATVRPTTADEVAQRYGVRVTLITVTKDGGRINCRFRVTDAAKAAEMLLKTENLPVLVAADSGATLKLPGSLEQETLRVGIVYNLLYPNVQNAVKPGDRVVLIIGDLRLEDLTAE